MRILSIAVVALALVGVGVTTGVIFGSEAIIADITKTPATAAAVLAAALAFLSGVLGPFVQFSIGENIVE